MTQRTGTPEIDDVRGIDQAFLMRAFYIFVVLALASAVIAAAGRWFGPSISMAGYSDDTSLREIVIGNNVLSVPANDIRFEPERRGGAVPRLDLYLRWPDLTGYSPAAKDDFNGANGRKVILFLSFEPRTMSEDMSGRYEPVYRPMIAEPGIAAQDGVTFYDFRPDSGYSTEVLAVAQRHGALPFVARCLAGAAAALSLAPCQRDIQIGDGLSLTYRFPRALLGNWQALEL